MFVNILIYTIIKFSSLLVLIKIFFVGCVVSLTQIGRNNLTPVLFIKPTFQNIPPLT